MLGLAVEEIAVQQGSGGWQEAQNVLDLIVTVMAIAGGSGGIAYWIDRFRNRPQLDVRDLKPMFFKEQKRYELEFEAENLGIKPTSLDSTIKMYGVLPNGRSHTARLEVKERYDRHLPPREPRGLKAQQVEGGLWESTPLLRTFVFRVSRGKGYHVRHVPWVQSSVSAVRFYAELGMFKLWEDGYAKIVDMRKPDEEK